jgi:hypothetical protein
MSPRAVAPDGARIGNWVRGRRRDHRNGRIAAWLAAECEAIQGWSWEPFHDAHLRNAERVRAFVKAHGWDELKTNRVVDGTGLGRWVSQRRSGYRRGLLDRSLIVALEAIPGWHWDSQRYGVERYLRELRSHVSRRGWQGLQQQTRTRSGVPIGNWVYNTRVAYRRKKLATWIVDRLEAIPGWTWEPRRSRQQSRVAMLASYVEEHGWDVVTTGLTVGGERLGAWISYCRVQYRKGELSAELVASLSAIPGWSWSPRARRRG